LGEKPILMNKRGVEGLILEKEAESEGRGLNRERSTRPLEGNDLRQEEKPLGAFLKKRLPHRGQKQHKKRKRAP